MKGERGLIKVHRRFILPASSSSAADAAPFKASFLNDPNAKDPPLSANTRCKVAPPSRL